MMPLPRLATVCAACVLLASACTTPDPLETPDGTDGSGSGAPTDGDAETGDASSRPGSESTGDAPSESTDGEDATEPPAPVRTVVLIPGTTISGSFFDEMAARLRDDGFEPVVFEPPDMFTDSLVLGAQRIDAFVREYLDEHELDRVHVVAECDGGVATRYWVQALGGHAHVDQVVTFVSAHHGTWTSPIGSWVTGWQALEDIVPGSPFMQLLDAAPWPDGLRFTSIYTCNDELLVPYETSVVDGATNVLFCDRKIGHFDGFWDPVVYDRIALTLRGEGEGAPTSY